MGLDDSGKHKLSVFVNSDCSSNSGRPSSFSPCSPPASAVSAVASVPVFWTAYAVHAVDKRHDIFILFT